MKVKEFARSMDMKVLTGEAGGDRDITGIYVCDLLSWVMAHASKGDGWITVHTHLNVAAVALLTEAACVIVPEGIAIEEATVKKASEEGISVLSSSLSSYEICYKAHSLIGENEV